MILDDHLKNLFQLLSIPSISGKTEHKKDIVKTVDWLTAKLTKLGFKARSLKTNGNPLVYGELMTNDKNPTVLIYGHYDVQAPEPLNEWISEPFKAEIRGRNIYARGVADDKGQVYTWIAAIEELIIKSQKPKANLKFIIEGEEEVGSENLHEFIQDNKPLLKADICVVSDSHCLSEDQPLIEYGLRGIVCLELTIKSLPKDVHSGLYGGNILNPIQIMSQVISKLKDEKHKILISDFYENVRRSTFLERRQLSKLPFTEKEVLEETGAKIVAGENKFTVQERAGIRPTLDVNGVWGGYNGEGPKTIIPGQVSAKISMRIVPNQTTEEVYSKFEKYIKEIMPKGVDYEIHGLSAAEPTLMNINSDYFRIAEESYKKIFGKKPIYGLSGGSIGAVADFKNILGIDSILMGYGLPDDGLHSPNEKMSLAMFEKGIKTNIEFLKSLG